jgi:thymidylate synthase ThyX
MENSVEIIGFYGSDEIIACSAWTSTSREITDEKRERIPKLINMLWSEHHETPFEKGSVHFLINCDIASHIHLLKHRISSLNAESARYKELKEDKFYIPEDWTEKAQKHLIAFTEMSNQWYHETLEELTPILGRKRAKESARYFKTYNSWLGLQ